MLKTRVDPEDQSPKVHKLPTSSVPSWLVALGNVLILAREEIVGFREAQYLGPASTIAQVLRN